MEEQKEPSKGDCGFLIILRFQGALIEVAYVRTSKGKGSPLGFPGGVCQNDDTPIEAAIRETEKETGLRIDVKSVKRLCKIYGENHVKYFFIAWEKKDEYRKIKPKKSTIDEAGWRTLQEFFLQKDKTKSSHEEAFQKLLIRLEKSKKTRYSLRHIFVPPPKKP